MTATLFILSCLLTAVSSGRAPDKSPSLPSGWCSEREGTLTATTGECMCRYSCEGKGCEKGQGMVWYAFSKCPSGCRCMPKEVPATATEDEVPFFKEVGSSNEKEPVQCSESKPADCGEETTDDQVDSQKKATTRAKAEPVKVRESHVEQQGETMGVDADEYDSYYGEEPEDKFPTTPEAEEVALSQMDEFLDWLDENYRLIFGGFVILLLSCTLVPSLMYVVKGGEVVGNSKATKETNRTSATPNTSEKEK